MFWFIKPLPGLAMGNGISELLKISCWASPWSLLVQLAPLARAELCLWCILYGECTLSSRGFYALLYKGRISFPIEKQKDWLLALLKSGYHGSQSKDWLDVVLSKKRWGFFWNLIQTEIGYENPLKDCMQRNLTGLFCLKSNSVPESFWPVGCNHFFKNKEEQT